MSESTAIVAYASNVGVMPVGVGLGEEALVLGVVDRLGLVDQHDRDVVAHLVATLEAGVVERRFVFEVQERSLVLGAREDLQQLRVERHRHSLSVSPRDEREDFGRVRVARGAVGALRG